MKKMQMQDHSQNGGRIDWAEVRTRIQGSAHWLESNLELNNDRARQILRDRAEALSRRGEFSTPTTNANTTKFLTFRLGGDHYAMRLSYLSDVVSLKDFTIVPRGSKFLVGLINFRGELRAVLDLAAMLERPTKEEKGSGQVLLLRELNLHIGFLVDEAVNVVQFDPDALRKNALGDDERLNPYSVGLTEEDVVVVDIPQLMQHPALQMAKKNSSSLFLNTHEDS